MDSFVDELLRVNQRIPRRVRLEGANLFIDSLNKPVYNTRFIGVTILSVLDFELQNAKLRKEFPFQLGRDPHGGMKDVGIDEVALALGNDFYSARGEQDIITMLNACELSDDDVPKAYFFPTTGDKAEGRLHIPVAYFEISPLSHREFAIDPKSGKFPELISRLRSKYG